MSKIILPVAVLASIALVVCDDASAGWRRARRRGCCGPTYPAVVVPAPAATYYTPAPATVAPSTNPPVAAAPTYRSYSYEPGTVSGGTYVPAQPYVQPIEPSQSHFFRADRKMHGLSWYRGK